MVRRARASLRLAGRPRGERRRTVMSMKTHPTERSVTLSGDAISRAVTVGAHGSATLARIIARIYPDRFRAVLRELACNSGDALRRKGVEAPIVITLPTPLNPTLTVTDRGDGMSAETIIDVFCDITASLSRGDERVHGNFGVGSKATWGLSDTFGVMSVRDGKLSSFTLYLDADGEPRSAEHARNIPTPMQDGTTITVPIAEHEVGLLRAAAGPVFAEWPSGSVEVDGELNVCEFDSDEWIELPSAFIYATSRPAAYAPAHPITVRSGSVSYDLAESQQKALASRLPRAPRMVLKDDALDLVPMVTRETLDDVNSNAGWLEEAIERVQGELIDYLRERPAATSEYGGKPYELSATARLCEACDIPLVFGGKVYTPDETVTFMQISGSGFAQRCAALRDMATQIARGVSVAVITGICDEDIAPGSDLRRDARAYFSGWNSRRGSQYLIFARQDAQGDEGWLSWGGAPKTVTASLTLPARDITESDKVKRPKGCHLVQYGTEKRTMSVEEIQTLSEKLGRRLLSTKDGTLYVRSTSEPVVIRKDRRLPKSLENLVEPPTTSSSISHILRRRARAQMSDDERLSLSFAEAVQPVLLDIRKTVEAELAPMHPILVRAFDIAAESGPLGHNTLERHPDYPMLAKVAHMYQLQHVDALVPYNDYMNALDAYRKAHSC